MLNFIWPIFIIISYIFGIFSGNLESLNESIFSSTKDAVDLSINLLGTMCLWNGIMKIASNTSIIEKINKFLKPIINYLFPDLKENENIKEEISLNMIANILGLGNASTPLGIKAMQSMQRANENNDKLSNSMMMFIVLNTASIQIIPTTVIAIRNSLGSNNPTVIVVPVWIATILAAISGILVTKILIKRG